MAHPALVPLLSLQSGVVSRRQAMQVGLMPHDLRRLERRRELARVHPGVYVDHTGPLTWEQRAWAGVLHAAPAALCDVSALRVGGGPFRPGDDTLIHVAVDRHRRIATPPGVRIHRVAHLEAITSWHRSPPRLRLEHAVLEVAARCSSDHDLVATLADAVQSRRTTAARLSATLDGLPALPRRRFIRAVLGDVAAGACSTLERGYLTRVERAHGLPQAGRQVRASARGPIYRDVLYAHQALVVELDGRLFHDTALARHHDLERDLDARVAGLTTVRLGWGQVFGTPCRTAARIAMLLRAGGWDGTAVCPDCR
ncbi:type IV toxin-antitoxin system AbiEi family antitoxin domain-containing protein [Nocardioides sp. Y6]|uniref:Type IV toxin-antitoxin system AbiEi family antitoxin domain-containing protein n=1 Tax=Nocardioides malaquae TaxID=2773426 RepID=A0ABR9RQT9_9ACTN|nr:type IV toxin-antitoxin system AbiEi family antitoxin domain-containing protein [Nocardioides malaquae]MBE7323944.1 type IV toxin-antitoxin system AbiEi family antitoxin domain-containing protein [Nocardioides malaquae]